MLVGIFCGKENIELIKFVSVSNFIGVGSKILMMNKFKIFVDCIKWFLKFMNI